MSYTNSTPNYGLPQYTADDKPTYLGDFNEAMSKVDTNLKNVDNKATSSVTTAQNANASAEEALQTANSAQSAVSQVSTTANQAKTTAENAQSSASNAQSDASSALTNANQAKSTAESAKSTANTAKSTADTAKSTADNLNISIKNWVSQNIGVNNANVMFNGNKLLNFVGISCNVLNGQGNSQDSNTIIGTLPEEFRPSEKRTINGACIVYWSDSNSTLIRNLTIKPDGTINCPIQNNFSNIMVQCMLCTNGWFD